MFKNLVNIIAAPKDAFTSLKEKPTVLVPLLLVILAVASLQWGYFNAVEREFLIEELIVQQQAVANVSDDQLRANLENLTPQRLAIQSAVSTAIFLTIILALYSGYLSLISKFTYDEIRYKQWFSLSCWTAVPVIFTAIAGWVLILTNSDGMIGTSEIQVLSLNNLIFHSEGNFNTLLDNLTIITFWSLALTLLGYRQWTGKSTSKSSAIILAPYVLIYGIWAVFILT